MNKKGKMKKMREKKIVQNVLLNRHNKRCVVALRHYANVTEWQQINEDGHYSLFICTEECHIAKPNQLSRKSYSNCISPKNATCVWLIEQSRQLDL